VQNDLAKLAPDLGSNLRAVSKWHASRWRQWMLMSFQGASPAPLRIPSRLDPLDALEELFTAALEPVRDNIKEGVVRAIREWDPQYYSLNGICLPVA
jgi:hypothetical protein